MTDRRTDAEIRAELSAEREGLASSLADLRRGVRAQRARAARVAGALGAGVAATVAVKVLRRLRRG